MDNDMKQASGGALQGVRILDLTHVVAGPFASRYLAMMGAEVIKLENPKNSGDANRVTGPFVNNQSARFCTLNHNKSSIAMDLSTAEGKELFLRMVEKCDVVLDNFRPGVLDRLGIGFALMKQHNPRIVYGSLSGFGTYGPYRDDPAYDVIAQAMSGIMWLNGWEGQPPIKVGTSIGDVIAGIHLVVGILAALRAVERTGEAQSVEVSLVDSLVSSLLMENISYLVDGTVPARIGNNYREWCPCGVYEACDGYYVLGVGTEAFFKALAIEVLQRPEMAEDPRFAGQGQRVKHRQEIDEILTQWGKQYTVEEVCDKLHRAGIPCARVNSIREVAADPHISRARKMFPSVPQPGMGEVPVTNIPVRFHELPEVPLQAAPAFGGQTRSILTSLLGLSEEEMSELADKGVIYTPEST